MASCLRVKKKKHDPHWSLVTALHYSSIFNYPLTLKEVWYWQPFSSFPKSSFLKWRHQKNGYLYLPGNQQTVSIRKKRETISNKKNQIARDMVRFLKFIPGVKAIYLTGSLAMNNCKKNDDIDIMIITSPNSTWITRFFMVLFLTIFSKRRPYGLPKHSSKHASDRFCDNLYLSQNNLSIPHYSSLHPRNYYLAHEILQAKLLFGNPEVDASYIYSNQWVKDYFPIAFLERSKNLIHKPSIKKTNHNYPFFIINLIFFLGQYLYMRPRLSVEHVDLNSAFFHPGNDRLLDTFLSSKLNLVDYSINHSTT